MRQFVHRHAFVGIGTAKADAAEVVRLSRGDAGVVIDVDGIVAEVAVGVVAINRGLHRGNGGVPMRL